MEVRWNDTPRHVWDTAMRHAAWQQNWAYGAALAAMGRPVHRAVIFDGGEVVGRAQVTGRRFLRWIDVATCTRGPVWAGGVDAAMRREAYRLLHATVPLSRVRGVFFTPEAGAEEGATLRAARLRQVMSPYSTAFLDLTAPEDALRCAMRGKWRNRLCRAEEAGIAIAVAPATPGEYAWLLMEEAEQQRRRRYHGSPPAFVAAWQGRAGRGDGVLLATATRAGERLGAMLFLRHGAGALYQFGTTSAAGRAANAHTLLLWEGMRFLRRRGVERLDLGGIDTVDLPGIARFKLGSGARVRTLCGTWC